MACGAPWSNAIRDGVHERRADGQLSLRVERPLELEDDLCKCGVQLHVRQAVVLLGAARQARRGLLCVQVPICHLVGNTLGTFARLVLDEHVHANAGRSEGVRVHVHRTQTQSKVRS